VLTGGAIVENQTAHTDEQSNSIRANRLTAYIYTRVSTPQQDLDGNIEKQLWRLAGVAKTSRIVIHRYYADRAVNIWEGNPHRSVGHQEALEQLKVDIVADPNPNKFIWVTAVDRIARNRDRGKEFFDWAMKNQISIYADDLLYDPTGVGASSWFDACVLAEQFGDRLSVDATEQHQESRISGRKKWGFRNVSGNRLMKVEAKAVVNELFQMALRGATVGELALHFGKSPAWGEQNSSPARLRSKVRQILHDPNYAGYEPIYGDTEHRQVIRLEPAHYEGAVSIRDFLEVQLLIPKKVVANSQEFYLAGRVNCGSCGKTLVAVRVDFRGYDYDQLKLVKSAYACPSGGCRPSQLYEAQSLHYEVKRLLTAWEQRNQDKGFYARWEASSRQEQKEIIKNTISRGRHLVATPAGLENPRWLRMSF
jgi:DNA invertase Pin-like site-specific DNA recombinase